MDWSINEELHSHKIRVPGYSSYNQHCQNVVQMLYVGQ